MGKRSFSLNMEEGDELESDEERDIQEESENPIKNVANFILIFNIYFRNYPISRTKLLRFKS